MSDEIEVHIWSGETLRSYESILSDEPDVLHLESGESAIVVDNPVAEKRYAFDVPNEYRPVRVDVWTNDSVRQPDDWGVPIERGLSFYKPDEAEPFRTKLRGRMRVEMNALDAIPEPRFGSYE